MTSISTIHLQSHLSLSAQILRTDLRPTSLAEPKRKQSAEADRDRMEVIQTRMDQVKYLRTLVRDPDLIDAPDR